MSDWRTNGEQSADNPGTYDPQRWAEIASATERSLRCGYPLPGGGRCAELIGTAWDPMIPTGESKGLVGAEINEQLRLHRKAVRRAQPIKVATFEC